MLNQHGYQVDGRRDVISTYIKVESTWVFTEKVTVKENVNFTYYVFGIRLPDYFKLAINKKNNNCVTIWWHDVIANFFDVVLFLLLSLVTGPSFMFQVPELWQLSFIRDWREIRKWEIPPSEFCLTSKDWGDLEMPNLAQMFLIKWYWMRQNATVTAFTVSELLRKNQQGVVKLPTIQIRVNV